MIPKENKLLDLNKINQINEYYTKKANMDNYNSLNKNHVNILQVKLI